jgi:hypothetical protein
VNWIELEEIQSGVKGHGILYWHRGIKGTLIAFVDGFGWLHNKTGVTNVEILSPDSKHIKESGLDGNEIITELKHALARRVTGKIVKKDGKLVGKFSKKIRSGING